MHPSRFRTFVIVAVLALVSLFILSPSSRHVTSEAVVKESALLQDKISSIDVPIRFSFHQSAHKPPIQKNSTNGDTSWYSDWRWLNPFSSSVTLDEDRAVLPVLPERPYIYTYYDTTITKDKAVKKVEDEILLTWRRAWWAQGFRPVVLTQADATANPLYRELQAKKMSRALEFEFSRWLAWAHMGTGLLADYYCFPMTTYNDPTLEHLRRGQYEHLTKFDGLGSGLFAGQKSQVEQAVRDAFADERLTSYSSITDSIDKNFFKIEQPDAFAYYESTVLQKKYPAIADEILAEPYKGLRFLKDLIISHLHLVWQNTFNDGIEVLKPLPAHTTALVEPALHLASLLAECPTTLLPSSCPPNRPKCSPCIGSRMPIRQPASFRNSSSIYLLATVPHPYTMITLNNMTDQITVPHIRRHTTRDAWITSATREVLGDGRGGPSRVIALKDAVASDFGRSRSLWFTVEHFPVDISALPQPEKVPTNDVKTEPQTLNPFPEHWLEEIDWHFGFPISRTVASHGESMNPVPLPERWQKGQSEIPEEKKGSYEPQPPTNVQQSKEIELLRTARQTIKSTKQSLTTLKDAAEKWNLADMEVWRFVKAYRARSVMELNLFEEEEEAYTSTGTGRKSRWW